ncbi:MAG: arabinan endo-1,5-alpha-L-arabinosidase [Caldilineaceae bacterium]
MVKKRLLLLFAWLLLVACKPITTGPTLDQGTASSPVVVSQPAVTLQPEGFIQRIHDPVMAKEGDTYYVFSTGSRLIVICSKNMSKWEWCGRVFEENPKWLRDAVPGVGDLWAPDISFWNGKWHLYYAGSTFGSNRSVIGLATNVTLDRNSPDYKWVDEGEVIASTIGDNWNAIDPNLAFDENGQPWLAFGSYWSGLKMRKIDAQTGKLAEDDRKLYPLATRFEANGSIEGAFIIQHGDFFYLFASFDFCCQGVNSTYNVRVGRSSNIIGPYVDREGKAMLEGGGTRILSTYDRWIGPGHNGIYQEGDTTWMVYHAYDALEVGIPKLRIESLGWDAEGWPYLPSQVK